MEGVKPALEVFVWLEDTRCVTAQALQAAQDLLCEEERQRLSRLRFAEDRRDFALSHALLRRSLSHVFSEYGPEEWEFERDRLGKPHVRRGVRGVDAAEFSLSHSRGAVACAVSSVPVGVDVERSREGFDYLGIARDNFTAQEVTALEALLQEEQMERFLELWTLKESFLKARGVGLAGGLKSVCFDLDEKPGFHFCGLPDVNVKDWRFGIFTDEPEVRLALAVNAKECRWTWPGRAMCLQGMTLCGE